MVSYSSLLNDRWLVPAAPHARAPAVYLSVRWHLEMCQPQESHPDIPQEVSPEEEPFEIELVVPEDLDTEDRTNEEHPPPSDTEDEKMYRDADEVESFRAESPILAGRLRALLEHLGITTAPQYRIKEVPCSG
jgi:hypothetical protein